ncbi:hypothetical protein [Nocardia sp. IFM 10818]
MTPSRSRAGASATTQLDLFGEVLASEQRRFTEGLTCLRDAVPDTLLALAVLRFHRRVDTRAPHASGDWAYCLCRAGLRFERAGEWWSGARARGEVWGWNRTPAHLLTWDELTALVEHDPRRADLVAWATSLPDPHRRLLHRPYALWPNPDHWHPDYLRGEERHPLWAERRHAWQLALDMLTTAITTVTAVTAPR